MQILMSNQVLKLSSGFLNAMIPPQMLNQGNGLPPQNLNILIQYLNRLLLEGQIRSNLNLLNRYNVRWVRSIRPRHRDVEHIVNTI